MSERYEFLSGQHEDLIEAEATLVKIIEELDAAMRKQFQEQFALISSEFDKVFRQLFGGGKGTLELMEDEDVLEAGIRIIALAGKETAEYDAAFRWRESSDCDFFAICDPELKAVSVLSAGRDLGGIG